MKPVLCANFKIYRFQPPSGGCVLKQFRNAVDKQWTFQPPSGGCVLKRGMTGSAVQFGLPAAFGRLCVETSNG